MLKRVVETWSGIAAAPVLPRLVLAMAIAALLRSSLSRQFEQFTTALLDHLFSSPGGTGLGSGAVYLSVSRRIS